MSEESFLIYFEVEKKEQFDAFHSLFSFCLFKHGKTKKVRKTAEPSQVIRHTADQDWLTATIVEFFDIFNSSGEKLSFHGVFPWKSPNHIPFLLLIKK